MKLATWNVNSLSVRLPQVLDWLRANPVDALALQELKLEDHKFPHQAFADIGYHAVCHGQKTYNGVAWIARALPQAVVRNIPGFDDAQARAIAVTLDTPLGPLRLVNGYFVNGQEPGSDKFAYKMRWLHALRAWLAGELQQHPRLVLAGDFNIAPQDADSWDPANLAGTILHTAQERAHFQALLDLGLADAFRLFAQPQKSWSWWDYRMLAFQKNRGLRIDHILVSHALRSHVAACRIDRAPRKNRQPSDHAPVLMALNLAQT